MNHNVQRPDLMIPNHLQTAGAWSLYPQLPVPSLPVPGPTALPQAKAPEISERDARLLKRKLANRDSARRSKLKKKQETEELVVKRTQLSDLHNDLIQRVKEAQARVRALQDTNGGLKDQYHSLLTAAEGGR